MLYKNQNIPRQDRFRLFAREVGPLFDISKAANTIGVPSQACAKMLARWHKQGLIARISHGIYALIPTDTPQSDFVLEDPWLLVPLLLSPGYVGGWTAAEYWDLTEQLFNSVMVFTTRPVLHKDVSIGSQNFRLKHINTSNLFGLQSVWRKNEKMMISDLHRTVIDFFNEPEIAGGLQHAVDCLKNYLKKPESDLNLLREYAEKLNNGAIYKRLGFLLEKFVGSENPIVIEFNKKLTQGVAYLDPKQKKEVRLVQKWRLFVPQKLNLED